MFRLPSFVFALLLRATALWADNHNTPTPMTTRCNANGAVIILRDGTTYYLGKRCDAAKKRVGLENGGMRLRLF